MKPHRSLCAPVGGALIGGAAGATIGAVTAPERTYYY